MLIATKVAFFSILITKIVTFSLFTITLLPKIDIFFSFNSAPNVRQQPCRIGLGATKKVEKKIFFQKRFADTQKLLIFALLFKSSTERWVSGLNQQFAKLSYGITVPGVRIPLSPPRRKFFDRQLPFAVVFFCAVTAGELAHQAVAVQKR